MNNKKNPLVLVTGGGGYVGTVLVPKLIAQGRRVRVIDKFLYGNHLRLNGSAKTALQIINGDIRNAQSMEAALEGVDAVIHLASISNDPSSELNPTLTKEINLDAVSRLVEICRKKKTPRLINASTSSVYGVKKESNVTEDLPLEPITLYAKYKAETEKIIQAATGPDFCAVSIRSATVCGYSPRMRLDLTVNILTSAAIGNGVITVFGGNQKRPNIHIEDITDLYARLLSLPAAKISGKIFNAGGENHTVAEIAQMVQKAMGAKKVQIVTEPSNDPRSYHICSTKIKKELGFAPQKTILDAIEDIKGAFAQNLIPDAATNPNYYNVKTLRALNFQ